MHNFIKMTQDICFCQQQHKRINNSYRNREKFLSKDGKKKVRLGLLLFPQPEVHYYTFRSLRSWWKKKFMLGGIKFYFKLFCSVCLWSGLAWTQLLSVGEYTDTSKTTLTSLMSDAWVCSELIFPTIIRSSRAWYMLIRFSRVQLFATHGLQPARVLCPWDSPGKNTGVGCHFLLQGILLTQGSNQHLLCLLNWQVDSLPLSFRGSPPILTV